MRDWKQTNNQFAQRVQDLNPLSCNYIDVNDGDDDDSDDDYGDDSDGDNDAGDDLWASSGGFIWDHMGII